MKFFPIRRLSLLLIYSSALFLSSCHEKGCTDPTAINYNIIADEDDGSCIICHVMQEETGTLSAYLTDYNFSSPHYNQVVAVYYVRQIKDRYNNSACNTSNQCRLYFKIKSLVNDTMNLPYQAQLSGNNIFFSYNGFEVINPFDTTEEASVPANISNPCGSFSFSTLTFSSIGTITYH